MPITPVNKAKNAITPQQRWKEKNPEKLKDGKKRYYKNNTKKIKEYSKEYYTKNAKERRAYNKQYAEKNREELRIKGLEYYKNNKEKHRNSTLKVKYGISLEEYNVLFEKQEYKCAICGIEKSENGKTLHCDHNHKTGKVRGLLCFKCNTGLGNFNDNVEVLLKAISYLNK